MKDTVQLDSVMGFFARDRPWGGLLATAALFAVAFLLHIWFAANDWELMFQLVAIDLFILSHATGPCIIIIGGQTNDVARKTAMSLGLMISLPLTIGYWWGVNQMQWAEWLPSTILLPILLHIGLRPWQGWMAGLLWPLQDAAAESVDG